MPKKRFGQNFLIDPYVARKIVEKAGVIPGEIILEIGAGKGMLTEALLEKGASVVAFEIDRDLFDMLKDKFKGRNVKFIFQDFLKFDGTLELNRCVSNIPYNISTPILKKLFNMRVPFITVMVQREYAQRLLAVSRTKAYGSLTTFVRLRYEVKKILDVNKESFSPVPSIDSSVVNMVRTQQWLSLVKDESLLDKIVRKAFSHKRKMIRNNLKEFEGIETMLETLKISKSARAEELSIEQFIKLSNLIFDWIHKRRIF